ncbi:MAG: type II toxin-antitoxin system HicA family toxin [Thermoflexia bacterium]|nr:MAG: type II toxin-antitoxin system HicA family toxin [Thermoflexia bacterium]
MILKIYPRPSAFIRVPNKIRQSPARDLNGEELALLLQRFGYRVTRQTGSHMRLTTLEGGEHHITIPRHKPLWVGTLNAILRDVAEHLGIERETLLRALFDK